eukprot:1385570-Amorphochlora_amoeboformis.AAC.1
MVYTLTARSSKGAIGSSLDDIDSLLMDASLADLLAHGQSVGSRMNSNSFSQADAQFVQETFQKPDVEAKTVGSSSTRSSLGLMSRCSSIDTILYDAMNIDPDKCLGPQTVFPDEEESVTDEEPDKCFSTPHVRKGRRVNLAKGPGKTKGGRYLSSPTNTSIPSIVSPGQQDAARHIYVI